MSEEKQLSLFNLPVSTLTSDVPSPESIKWGIVGQTHTKNPNSIRVRELCRTRKRQLVEYKGGRCESCLKVFHPNVFDFHHHDHTKKRFNVSQKEMQRSWNNLIKEADKCHLLCSNCHREVHLYNPAKFIKL